MFIGHWAPAFAAAAVSTDRPRLGAFFVAGQVVDWAFFPLFMSGIERARIVPGITEMSAFDFYHMPYTHSLLGTLVFAIVFGLFVRWVSGSERGAILAGAVVLSHWVLDLLVHRPDLTLAGGANKLGLGLWNHPAIEIPLELGITLAAFAWYMRATSGRILPAMVLIGVMLVAQAVSWFGPQPVDYSPALPLTAIAAFGVITALAFWTGKTRTRRARPLAGNAAAG